ncbi:hypothetical protein [Rhodococcus sp. (in: high G+C Gram-positive bacteria)]|uniref:hypothetical protein n=1 Tax=Rhodococcus sp. TaxID=1831 RepID=UPI003B8A7E16
MNRSSTIEIDPEAPDFISDLWWSAAPYVATVLVVSLVVLMAVEWQFRRARGAASYRPTAHLTATLVVAAGWALFLTVSVMMLL